MKRILKKLYDFSSSWTGTIIIVLFIIFFVIQPFIIPSASMQNSLLIGDFLFAKKFSYGIPTPRFPLTNTKIFPDIFDNGHLLEGKRPQRGDIVIFLNPVNNNENYVKRCFARGGDEVIYKDDAFYLHLSEGDEYIKNTYPSEKIVEIAGKLWVIDPYKQTYPGINYKQKASDESLIFKRSLIETDNPSPFILMSRRLMVAGQSAVGMSPIKIAEFDTDYNSIQFNAFYIKVPQDEFFMIGDNRDNSQDSRFFGSIPYKLIIGKPWFVYFSMDSNKIPRWERIGKFVSTLDKKEYKEGELRE
ncbi:MAG: signal peptidase I [Campylobacteraceae bacterium]|jgi:signal peptidase I|nr:signal peptidase I [Campylobacteraceae bacterium]